MSLTRIDRKFRELGGRKALITFITAGDPSLEATAQLVLCLERHGADIIELGIPFSDPLMDGPTIQMASRRSLQGGTKVPMILEAVRSLRHETRVPILFMTCYNPIYRFGVERFAEQAAQAGVDGILITDLPPEESKRWKEMAELHDLNTIFLLAPTSTPERIKEVCQLSSGFIYCISRTGVTGARAGMPEDLGGLIQAVRSHTDKPVAIGFGVSGPDQARMVARWADGVIVGSAIVDLIARYRGEKMLEAVGSFVAGLKAAMTD